MSDNTPDFRTTQTLTARVEHKCCECYKTIKIGNGYKLTMVKRADCIDKYKQCIDCANVFDSIIDGKVDGYEELAIGGLDKWISYNALAILTLRD